MCPHVQLPVVIKNRGKQKYQLSSTNSILAIHGFALALLTPPFPLSLFISNTNNASSLLSPLPRLSSISTLNKIRNPHFVPFFFFSQLRPTHKALPPPNFVVRRLRQARRHSDISRHRQRFGCHCSLPLFGLQGNFRASNLNYELPCSHENDFKSRTNLIFHQFKGERKFSPNLLKKGLG